MLYITLLVFLLLILGIILVFSFSQLRRLILIKPFFDLLKKALPSISKTEEIVLEAGDTWWEKHLFRGKPDWYALHKISLSELTIDEKAFLDNQVESLCSMLEDYKILTEYHDLPPSVWSIIKQSKFFGLVIPKKYGGLGFSALAHSTIILKIATRSVSAAVTVLVPNSLGPAELLLNYGTNEQKEYYLPRLVTGEEIPCFALTSLQAGSDATAIIDNGVVCMGEYKGQEVLGLRLNFDKRYITLAPIATLIGVAFKLFDPEHLIGSISAIGITVALVPTELPGVEIGKRHSPMGLAFLNGPVRGKDVFIPLSFVIGGKKMLGQGWRMLMECLSIGRGISLPAVSAAQSQLAYRMTGAYSVLREQFKQPLVKFEGIEAALARIAGFSYLMEATRRFTVTAVDASLKPALASSIAKYHMTEFARTIVNDAMDIHGGRGIQLGPRNYLAQGYIAIPISITVEGANILTRNLILFGQGAVRCHPFLLDEIKALQKNDIGNLDALLVKHFCYGAKNLLRTFSFAFGIGYFFVKSPFKAFNYYYCQLSRMSSALALVTDFTLLALGGTIKRKERLSARLGDVLSYLYLASSVLRYYQDYTSSKEDSYYTQWALNYCLYHIQYTFEKFFINFPHRFLGKLFRFIIFPLGRSYTLPNDKEDKQLVETMTQISVFRDRLTQYCYLGKGQEDTTGRMELAFKEWIGIKKIRKKISGLKKEGVSNKLTIEEQLEYAKKRAILTKTEVEQFLITKKIQENAMQVDEF
ncbi:MAG: acyl-CoA dehydrogenase [Rickettsiella sp.]|nr:acyl-CoA dehydrogenase [Rickettsiella sp.]